MYAKAKKFRTLYPNGDGLGLWRQVKKDLDDNCVFFTWKPYFIPKKIQKTILKLPEFKPEANHFYIQLVSIPSREHLKKANGTNNLRKLIQLALNAGQLEPNISQMDKSLQNLYKKYKLNKMKTYLNTRNIEVKSIPNITESFIQNINRKLEKQFDIEKMKVQK